MTDTHTAQPAQATEDDMGKVRQMFDNIINTAQKATGLITEVDRLSAQVAELVKDVEKVRRQNDFLDEQVSTLRQQRDDARSQAKTAQENEVVARQEAASAKHDLEQAHSALESSRSSILDLKKARDDAEFKVMELEDKLKEMQAKVDQFLGIAQQLSAFQPKAVPEVQHTQDVGMSSPEPTQSYTVEPEPQASNETISSDGQEALAGWKRDPATGRWVRS